MKGCPATTITTTTVHYNAAIIREQFLTKKEICAAQIKRHEEYEVSVGIDCKTVSVKSSAVVSPIFLPPSWIKWMAIGNAKL